MKTTTIGIIGALHEDIQAIVHILGNCIIEKHYDRMVYVGNVCNYKIVIVASGIGKVNASMTTQYVIDKYNVEYIINIGIAGSLTSQFYIGDVVIIKDAIQHDIDLTSVGCAQGVIPRMRSSIFETRKDLVASAVSCIRMITRHDKINIGRLASGDQFISDPRKKESIKNIYSADIVDMEGAAIAQTATLNKIPFLIIKYISDNADNTAPIDYRHGKKSVDFFKEYMLFFFKMIDLK